MSASGNAISTLSRSSRNAEPLLDPAALVADLRDAGFDDWAAELGGLLQARLAPGAHGNLPEWIAAIGQLPAIDRQRGRFDRAAVGVPDLELTPAERESAVAALRALAPWRKGLFCFGDIEIDTEWRSNLKWDRVAAALGSLEGRQVLDVGCGNGYYAWRMRAAGAERVIGIDPTLLYVAQFAALNRFLLPEPVHVLPLRLEDLPPAGGRFDTAFSMGVLYHSRAPIEHLRALRDAVRPAGEVVLETIVLPGNEALSRTPPDRYARMRNVWHLPSVPELLTWLDRTGLRDAQIVDVTPTTTDEQRSTGWMTFESLAEALDPDDPSRTVEGWPAPHRAIVIAKRPA